MVLDGCVVVVWRVTVVVRVRAARVLVRVGGAGSVVCAVDGVRVVVRVVVVVGRTVERTDAPRVAIETGMVTVGGAGES